MIDRDVFYQRKNVCEQCEFWKNRCLKGHLLQSPTGCPVKKFGPVLGAGYHPDLPVERWEPYSSDCCG